MSYENVRLWFAKDQNDSIVTINEIEENNTYTCPVCGSELVPKAIESAKVASHFAHIDSSKCNGESMLHFWFKHKFIEVGDTFAVSTDKEHTYICKEIQIEQDYDVESKTYKPDITIITECGERIFFEMNYSNKKEVKDYIDIWLELKKIVVEIDIKSLTSNQGKMKFKALFYNGKCFNIKKNDMYYSTIGKYKEEKLKGNVNKELKQRIKRLDWFWSDVLDYKKGKVSIDQLVNLIDSIDGEDRELINRILSKNKCKDVHEDYYNCKLNNVFRTVSEHLRKNIGVESLKYLSKSLIDYGDHMKASIVIDSFYWREGFGRSLYMYNKNGTNDYFNIENYSLEDLKEIILNKMKLNLKYIQYDIEIFDYKNKERNAIDLIETHANFKELVDEIKLRNKDYTIEINSSCSYIDSKDLINKQNDLNYLTLSIDLNVNKVRPSAMSFEIKENIKSVDIDKICLQITEKINDYFKNLSIIDVSTFDHLTESLISEYEDCKINISGKSDYEDIYRIWVEFNERHLSNFNLTNDGIVVFPYTTSSNDRRFKLKASDLKEIKNYVTEDINDKLREKLKFKCIDCEKETALGIGEFKFFNKKGFELPKRCKKCRNKRKNKGE